MTDTPETAPAHLQVIDHRLDDIDNALDRMQQDAVVTRQTLDKIRIIEDSGPPCDKLFAALAKAQAEIKNAEHDAEADAGQYKYKYATLDAVLNAVRGPLSANGLSIMQLPGRKVEEAGKVELVTLTTILAHSSGQSVENYFEMYPPKRDPQGIGSAMTYMRRYVIMAMCGIAGAADDDAEKTKPGVETISADQADQIFNLADDLFGSDSEALLERMCEKIFIVDAVAKIPAHEFDVAMRRIENTRKRKDREAAEAKAKAAEGGEAKPEVPPADEKPAKAADKKPSSKPSMSGK